MSEKKEGRNFTVSAEDCERWMQRLRRMADTLDKKDGDHEDGVKMFYTCAVLMQKLGLEIQRDAMYGDVAPPFGGNNVGEA